MRGLIAAILMLSAGCSKSDPRICGHLAMKLPFESKTADDQKQVTYSCVERWAARLAHSPDNAAAVAVGAVAACEDAIALMQERMAAEGGWEGSLELGPGFWQRRAQFIVVQTRAGGCYPDA